MAIKLKQLPSTSLSISSPFGSRVHPITGKVTPHKGVDIRPVVASDPIRTVLPGTIKSSYWNAARGWVVIVDHGTIEGKKVSTLYQHLKAQCPRIVGSSVKAGQTLGIMGTTGSSTGIHLHFELIIDGVQIDPAPYLENVGRGEDMPIYERIDELTGDWKEAVLWALSNGIIKGNGKTMGLREPEVKALVFIYRDNLRKSEA